MVALEKGPGAKVVEALVKAGADVNSAASGDSNDTPAAANQEITFETCK